MSWGRKADGETPVHAVRSTPQVGVVQGALGSGERAASLAALFPEAQFSTVSADWNEHSGIALDVLIVALAAADAEAAIRWLKTLPTRTRVAVVLHDADVATTRRLVREGGASEVLPAPASEPALASALDRLFAAMTRANAPQGGRGQVVAVLKAGGGVGATSLAVQASTTLARRGISTCLADLDLQFGAASAYLDLPDAFSVMDCLSAGTALAETPFATALARHASGVRLLASSSDIVPLEALTAAHVDALLTGLRRDHAVTILDLPSVWTAWTYQALRVSDRIVLVTQLSVPHMQLMKRQLAMLAQQQLDQSPLTIVCNMVSPEQQASLSVKTAEKALGRTFDIVISRDDRTMNAAVNEGVELSAAKRGTKLEKAIATFAAQVAHGADVSASAARGKAG